MRFERIFAGVYCRAERQTNRSGAAKIGNCSHYAASFVTYLEMCGRL